MSQGNKVIKGSFKAIIYDRGFWLTLMALILSLMCIYQLLFSQLTIENFDEALFALIGGLGMAIVCYYLTRESVYYYEIADDRLIVKNPTKKTVREFYFDKIQLIIFSGFISMPRKNVLGINCLENDVKKHYSYSSVNLGQHEWEDLISSIESLGIACKDIRR